MSRLDVWLPFLLLWGAVQGQDMFFGCAGIDPRQGGVRTLPHTTNCSLYLQCDGGLTITVTCPAATYYDVNTLGCTTPSYLGCSFQGTGCAPNCAAVPVRPVLPTSTTTLPPFGTGSRGVCTIPQQCSDWVWNRLNICQGGYSTGLPPGILVVVVTPNNPTVDVRNCTEGDRLPNPTNCNQFWSCQRGRLVPGQCPSGLSFNPVLRLCDLPARAGCAGQTAALNCPTCPATTDLVLLPRPGDCSSYCRCDAGTASVVRCPAGLNFNPVLGLCDWIGNAGCAGACGRLTNSARGQWSPGTCTNGGARIGDSCTLTCRPGFELSGSLTVSCTASGWASTSSINRLPACRTPQELADEFFNQINTTLAGRRASFLFILDESGSVSPAQFDMEKTFVSAVVNAFPLSAANRSAGAISFNTQARVNIRIWESDTCRFLRSVQGLRRAAGGTDIARALSVAARELPNSPHNLRLVFLISDGNSTTNPLPGAEAVKRANGVLFTIGVANYDRAELEPLASRYINNVPLFFGVSSFEVFGVIASYLGTRYNQGAIANC